MTRYRSLPSGPVRSRPQPFSTGAAGSFFGERVVRRDGTLQKWWTLREFSRDKRTSAVAEVHESTGGWAWKVTHSIGTFRGSSTNQKGARAAARRCVRKLPSADTKPDRQLDLFK